MSMVKKANNVNQQCVYRALKIFGDKWTPLIVQMLAKKTSRFCEIQDEVGGINPRTLSLRLVRLEEMGIIKKTIYSEIPLHSDYKLTKKGNDLVPILKSMVVWGKKYRR